jgi:hypothetical protein
MFETAETSRARIAGSTNPSIWRKILFSVMQIVSKNSQLEFLRNSPTAI